MDEIEVYISDFEHEYYKRGLRAVVFASKKPLLPIDRTLITIKMSEIIDRLDEGRMLVQTTK